MRLDGKAVFSRPRTASPLLSILGMPPDPISSEVLDMLAEELAIPVAGLGLEQRLVEDLGLDSLKAVRVLAAVEERFGVELISTDYLAVRSVADLVAFVVGQLPAERAHP